MAHEAATVKTGRARGPRGRGVWVVPRRASQPFGSRAVTGAFVLLVALPAGARGAVLVAATSVYKSGRQLFERLARAEILYGWAVMRDATRREITLLAPVVSTMCVEPGRVDNRVAHRGV